MNEEQPIDLGGEVLEAYRLHIEALVRAEVEAELEAADRAKWAPVREQLQRTRGQRTWADQAARRRQYPPVREVRATADWTPVQIPGRPGWWRHFIDGQQVDLPGTNSTEVAA